VGTLPTVAEVVSVQCREVGSVVWDPFGRLAQWLLPEQMV